MIKDLTTLKWRKSIYYVSNNVIFEIANKKKQDLDECGTYLIDNSLLEKVSDGAVIDLKNNPELFINNIPYIKFIFSNDDNSIERYFPLQYLIEEGDIVIEGKVIQKHPDIYNGSYVHKFNNEIYNYIRDLIKNKSEFDSKNFQLVMNSLPDWLTVADKLMTENYIDKYFLKGIHYNSKQAQPKGDEPVYQLSFCGLGIGDELTSINFWTENIVKNALNAIYVEKIINKYKTGLGINLSVDYLENLADNMKSFEQDDNNQYNLKTFFNNDDIKFESVCAGNNINSWDEYLQSKPDYSKNYDYIKDEESWNQSYANGGLKKYYEWSDRVNAPYKEDLWNTVQNRAANINDARKNSQGEFELDENGNYIYDNCERCWLGAVNAPGAKYPWIVPYFDNDVNSIIKFKYNYDNEIKEVSPWGDKVFGIGKKPDGSDRLFGAASVPAEFEDNDFLITENRTDGGSSTFDISKFEMEVIPV